MNNSLNKLDKLVNIKNISYLSLFLNLASIILAIIYLITVSSYNIFWDIFGIVLLITLFSNILLVYLNSIRLNKSNKLGNRLNLICYFYLVFTMIAMIGLFLSNFLVSVTYSNSFRDFIFTYGMVLLFFFGDLSLGVIISYLNVKNLKHLEMWRFSDERSINHHKGKHLRVKRILKSILKILSYLTLGVSLFFSLVLIFGTAIGGFAFMFGVFLPSLATFLSFFFLSTTELLLKLKNKRKNPKIYFGIAICGLFVTGIFMTPLSLAPYTAFNAENNFREAFEDWRGKIDVDDEPYFLKTHFSIPQYFLGIPPQNCIVKENVLFYKGTKGVDEGKELYFDAYFPLNRGLKPNGDPLPGKNSTIIRIHGGAWIMGDKGYANMLQMNKYFAAQGYVVFDIQYGLKGSVSQLATPDYLLGNFSMDDMIRHIGIFTQYLANHSSEYGANLDVVFVSGGSAGGQLTCATALAIHSGEYEYIFGSNITIKGLIPFYPANNGSRGMGINGDPRIVDPVLLVNTLSPPCLIFQGTHDPLERASRTFRDKYLSEGNQDCAIIWLYLGGHAADIYFSAHFNQIFLFYMERFLYMCVNNYIY